ncbi:hypothetical protein [Myxococcus eversor]|nr:hypothetical protein [Myxococcus eversor]
MQPEQRPRVRWYSTEHRDTGNWTREGPVRLGSSPNLAPAAQEVKLIG